jgi:hypothetical protein
LIRTNPQLSFESAQEESEIDNSPVLKRFLKIHNNKTFARKMIMEYGEEQLAKNLDYVEVQLSAGKVKSAPAFLRSAVQNNYISDDQLKENARKKLEDQAKQIRILETATSERDAKSREIDRAYSKACIEAIEAAFTELDPDAQRTVEKEFLDSADFGSFQIKDFRQNSWASRMVLSQSIKFWMGRDITLPRMFDVAKKFGVEDFEAYRAETDRMKLELENA